MRNTNAPSILDICKRYAQFYLLQESKTIKTNIFLSPDLVRLYMSLFIFPFPLFPYDTIDCFLIKQKVEQAIDFSKEEYKMYAITLGWFSNINIPYPINVYSYKAGLSCKANIQSTIQACTKSSSFYELKLSREYRVNSQIDASFFSTNCI